MLGKNPTDSHGCGNVQKLQLLLRCQESHLFWQVRRGLNRTSKVISVKNTKFFPIDAYEHREETSLNIFYNELLSLSSAALELTGLGESNVIENFSSLLLLACHYSVSL